MTEYEKERKQQILEIIKGILLKKLPVPVSWATPIEGLVFSRRNENVSTPQCFAEPMAIVVIQGQKFINFINNIYDISPGQCMVISVESPHSAYLGDTTPEQPFLALHFLLEPKILADLLTEMSTDSIHGIKSNSNMQIIDASLEFMETLLRLVMLTDKPDQLQIMAPLVLRELHYLLLIGPEGYALQNLYMAGARDRRIMDAIAWLKTHINSPVSVETLAKKVNMSVSSLHRQFKLITGFSPLQYQKRLRLCEAQRLMLAENERADMAALAVGYESITQFNREYKRLFGQPPHRDITARKKKFETNLQS